MRTTGSLLSVLPENFKDTWRFRPGLNYQYKEKTVLRAGVACDQSPVNDIDCSARLPDNDRTWLTIGGRYKYSSALNFDVGAAYIFVKDGSIYNRAIRPASPATASSTVTSTATSSWCRRRRTIGGSRLHVGRRPPSSAWGRNRAARIAGGPFFTPPAATHSGPDPPFFSGGQHHAQVLDHVFRPVFCGAAFGAEVGGVKLADKATVGGQDLVLNGAGNTHPRRLQGLRR